MKDLFLIMPEVFLALTLAFIVACEISYHGEKIRLVSVISLIGLAGALVQVLICYQYEGSQVFGNVLSIDGFSLFFKTLFIVLAILSVFSASHSKEISSGRRTEYYALLIASTLAMCFIASASDLILAFLSLFFVNILSFFLAGYGRKSVLATEAAVKYFSFGAVSIALLLYALAILFALTHCLNIYEMHKVLVTNPLSKEAMLVIFLLLFLGLSVPLGSFPMYLVVPDILEGSSTGISAFLSFGPRAAAFAFLTRFVIGVFTESAAQPGNWQTLGGWDWTQMIALVSSISMVFGALLALRQKGAKRLVSYLVVAETGFLLMGLLVLDQVGIAALLYNLVIELFALCGIFYVLSFFFDQLQSDRLEDLKGMLKRAAPESICLVLFLLCLVGVPPTPGFIGKFALIGAAIRHQKYGLAGIAMLAMVISSVAVARLSYSLIGNFKKQTGAPFEEKFLRKSFLAALMIPTGLAGIFAEFVFRWAGQSLGFIFW